ncbi:Eco47II family restriction endonuclease [Candidatus Peregrinibacteria bacterium]|nr:Eco47II family restriction endonuclease [Candidatus Peregrinibacteria bacterium]
MPYLKFISDSDLLEAIKKLIQKIENAERDVDSKLYKNVLDPFSALFEGITHGISYNVWLKSEKVRQIQKTMQNAVGDFHQDILGSIDGCENMGSGGGLDICNRKKKIVAEIKNKFNTTKGNHKIEIYDAIKSKLKDPRFKGFVGYYVEIIPSKKKIYDLPFTPSDNKIKKRRASDPKIRIIDGKSFYDLVVGRPFALQELFEALPNVIAENFQYKFDKKEVVKYLELFAKAYEVR